MFCVTVYRQLHNRYCLTSYLIPSVRRDKSNKDIVDKARYTVELSLSVDNKVSQLKRY